VEADVGTFVGIDVHGSFSDRSLMLGQLGPHDVVGGADGDALREFTAAVGDESPASFLVVGATDLYRNSGSGLIRC